MIEKEIINDMKFRQCSVKYGLDWQKYRIFNFRNRDYVILLTVPNKEIYILLDKNYNTICIEKCDWINDHKDTKYYVTARYETYCSFIDELPYREKFGYPFEKFTLKQIVDLSNRIDIHEINHGHSSNILVNGDIVSGENDKDYICLLSYIKFLGEQIQQYFLNAYQMKMIGFEYPDVYSYIRSIMTNINECIDNSIKNNTRPFPVDVIRYLGQNIRSVEQYDHELYNIIDLVMKQRGFKAQSGFKHYKEIEPTEISTEDLSILSINLLKILELSDEDFNQKLEEINKTMHVRNIDLSSWLEEKISKGQSPVLKRDKK